MEGMNKVNASEKKRAKLTNLLTTTEQTRFVLSPREWREFNAALDAPARDIPALRKLFNEPSVFGRDAVILRAR
jgi:uncharacterized protein (DUF1778 family)